MSVREYIGARYVPVFMGEWSNATTYEPLSIVTNKGNSYTSRQYVPTGIAITNNEYWALTGNYNAQVEGYRQEVQALMDTLNYSFENIEAMKADDSIQLGNICTTAGFHEAGDKGSCVYIISDSGTPNDIDVFECENGNAVLLYDSSMNVECFGAYGDNVHDDSEAIQYAVDHVNEIVLSKTYKCNSGISVTKNCNIKFDKGVINFKNTVDYGFYFNHYESGVPNWLNATVYGNGKINGNGAEIGITADVVYLLKIKDIQIYNCKYGIKTRYGAGGNSNGGGIIVDNITISCDEPISNSVAIYDNGYDNSFSNIYAVNYYTGYYSLDGNFNGVTAWLDENGSDIYPYSTFATIAGGNTKWVNCSMDTLRYGFTPTASLMECSILNFREIFNSGVINQATYQANVPCVVNNTDYVFCPYIVNCIGTVVYETKPKLYEDKSKYPTGANNKPFPINVQTYRFDNFVKGVLDKDHFISGTNCDIYFNESNMIIKIINSSFTTTQDDTNVVKLPSGITVLTYIWKTGCIETSWNPSAINYMATIYQNSISFRYSSTDANDHQLQDTWVIPMSVVSVDPSVFAAIG